MQQQMVLELQLGSRFYSETHSAWLMSSQGQEEQIGFYLENRSAWSMGSRGLGEQIGGNSPCQDQCSRAGG